MKRQIKKLHWWLLTGTLFIVVAVSATWWWWPRATTHRAATSQPTSSESHEQAPMSGPAYTAADTAVALFAHHARRGAALSHSLVKNKTISLATLLAKSGEAALRGKALSDGLFLYLNKINTEYGGLGGTIRISLDQRDDGGRVLPAAHEISKLLDAHSLYFSTMGDEALEKIYVPLMQAHKAAFLFPVAGVRPPMTEQLPLIFFRPSYTQEVAALVHYAVEVLKKKKVAVFYEESEWGRRGKQAVEQLLRQHQLQLHVAGSYQPGSVNVQSALAAVQKAEPHVVICIANGRPAYNFIREAVNRKLHYVSFLGISLLSGIAQHLQDSRGISLVTSSVVPNPYNSSLAIAQEYRSDMQQYLPNKGLSTSSLEGYINSMLLTHFLQKLSVGATIQDLISSCERMKPMNFKGLDLAHHNHTLSHTVWINEGRDNKWHEYVVRNG